MSEHERHPRPPRFVPTLTEVVDGQVAPSPGDWIAAPNPNEAAASGLPQGEAFTVAPLLKSRDGADGNAAAAGALDDEPGVVHPPSGEAVHAAADFAFGSDAAALQPFTAKVDELMPQPWAPSDGFFSPPVGGEPGLPAQPLSGFGVDDAARLSVPAELTDAVRPAAPAELDQAPGYGTERDRVLDDLERLSDLPSDGADAPLDWNAPLPPPVTAVDAGAGGQDHAGVSDAAFNLDGTRLLMPQSLPSPQPAWQPETDSGWAASSDGLASAPSVGGTAEAQPQPQPQPVATPPVLQPSGGMDLSASGAPQPGIPVGAAWPVPPLQDLPATADPLARIETDAVEGLRADTLGPLAAAETTPAVPPTTPALGSQAPQADPADVRALLPDDFQEQLLHRVMQRVDAVLTDRVGEVIAAVIERQTRSLLPSIREELEEVIRKSVDEAMADELAAATLPNVQTTTPGNA